MGDAGTFGWWTVVGEHKLVGGKRIFDWCRCRCGTEKFVRREALRNGMSMSCGSCGFKRTHGMHNTPTYLSWQQAKKRCETPTDKDYPSYGGRGIRFCSRWDSFDNFFADMGECPPGLTLGRQDNNGNYEPGNCKWETRTRQARNKRNTTWLTVGEVTMSLPDWSDKNGVQRGTIRARLRNGWGVARAVGET